MEVETAMTERDEMIEKAVEFKQDTNNKDFKSIPQLMADFALSVRPKETFTKEQVINFIEWIADMGWYAVKDKGKITWEHDDECGKFQTTADMVNHYLDLYVSPEPPRKEEGE